MQPKTRQRIAVAAWFMLPTALVVGLLLIVTRGTDSGTLRSQCRSNMHQILICLANYEETYGYFPPATVPNPALPRHKRLSWMVHLLPFMEEQARYRWIDRTKAWDDPANARPLGEYLEIYECPAQDQNVDDAGFSLAHYAGVAGVGIDGLDLSPASPRRGIFSDGGAINYNHIHDGTSQTAIYAEVNGGMGPWCAGGTPTARPVIPAARPINSGKPFNFGSPHDGGAFVGFVDSQVRFVNETVDPAVFRALCTIKGGEVIRDEDY